MTARSLAMTLSLAALLLAALAGGCSSQFGEDEKIGCLPIRTTVLAIDEPSELGFSGRDVLDGVGTSHTGELAWADGTTTSLTIGVAYDGGEVRFHDNEWVDDSGRDVAPATGCPDTVEVDVQLAFATMDGAFAEAWDLPLIATAASSATFGEDVGEPAGTFDPVAHVPPGDTYDAVRAWVAGSFDASGVRGEVSGQGERTEGDIASATMIDMATFEATRDSTSEALVGCLPVTTTLLGRSDPSPLGFSADDVLAWAETSSSFELQWADGTRTPATLAVRWDGGTIEHRDNEWMSAGGADVAPALGCEDDVRIEVTVSFQTEDGAFAESWTTAIVATSAARALLHRELGSVSGTFDPSAFAPSGHAYDTVRAFFDATLETTGTTGTIAGQGEGTSGSGPDGTAFAEMFAIASW